MTNLLEQAIKCEDGDQAAEIIQNALGIESDDVVNYCFPKTWPADRDSAPQSAINKAKTEAGRTRRQFSGSL
jgi:hypothetical protein